MAKKKFGEYFKYASLTTPNFTHADFAFAAEVLTQRKAISDGYELPSFFWRKDTNCQQKYKDLYLENIECARKLMKSVPHHFVIQCFIYTRYLENANYGVIVNTVKKRWETWNNNLRNRVDNLLRQQKYNVAAAEEMKIFIGSTEESDDAKTVGGRKREVRL